MDFEVLAGVFALAFLCEGVVEYLFVDMVKYLCAILDKWIGVAADPAKVIKLVAVMVGVGLCFAYSIDLITLLGLGLTSVYPWVGYVLSGIVIGRGSNYLNDFLGLTDRPIAGPNIVL